MELILKYRLKNWMFKIYICFDRTPCQDHSKEVLHDPLAHPEVTHYFYYCITRRQITITVKTQFNKPWFNKLFAVAGILCTKKTWFNKFLDNTKTRFNKLFFLFLNVFLVFFIKKCAFFINFRRLGQFSYNFQSLLWFLF